MPIAHTTTMRAAYTTESPVLSEGASAAREIAARWSTRISLQMQPSRMSDAAGIAGLVFLLLAATALLLRPSDLVPALAEWEIYKYFVLACLVCSLRRVAGLLRGRSLQSNAITALVLLLVPSVMLSHLAHADTYDARIDGIEMAKACVFFLLMVALIDSVRKLKLMLGAAAAAIFGVTLLSVAQHKGLIHLPALAGVMQSAAESGGSPFLRLCGTGVFNDPNDFSLVIVLGGVVCVYGLGESRLGRWRWAILLPLAIFGYALILTHSRGGLMAAVATVLALVWARMGWRSAMLVCALMGAVLLLPFWGRQASLALTNPEDTFQTRLYLWGESLDLFRASPLFGIGQGKVVDATGHVTHNSFLHAFTEMGVLGGCVFAGVFYLVVSGLWRPRPPQAHTELTRLRPYVLAIVVGYATGLLALSRCYTVPTQFVLALGAAYLMIEAKTSGIALPRLNWACMRRISGIGALFLVGTYVFIRVMMQQVQS